MSFLPSYLRWWIKTEKLSSEKDRSFFYDLQEATNEKDDWVVISYRRPKASVDKNELDDLLQQYIVIETHTARNNEGDEPEKSNTVDFRKRSTGLSNDTVDDNGKRKRAKNQPYTATKLRSAMIVRARRYCRYVGIPNQFPKFAKESNKLEGNAPEVTSFNSTERLLSSSSPTMSSNNSLQSKGVPVENRIVPYYGSKHQAISPSDVLQAFNCLLQQTSTVVAPCDFPQFSTLPAIHDVCVKYTDPNPKTFQVINACYLGHSFIPIKLTGQLDFVSPVRMHMVSNPVVLSLKNSSNDNHYSKDAYEDIVIQDNRESPSKIFSINSFESFYTRFFSTKSKFESLLKSVMVLHCLLNKKLESWKSTSSLFWEFPLGYRQISTPKSTPASGTGVHCNTKHQFLTNPRTLRHQADVQNVTAKQIHRQNRRAMRNQVTNSNRQRGMKSGRFNNNVGHRESWH